MGISHNTQTYIGIACLNITFHVFELLKVLEYLG